MMYQDKLVTAVRVAGKVLREDNDKVHLPFGSEYSLLIKNKNSVRALVRVEIDGVDATEGTSLIIPANGSIDFERFLKSSNHDQGLKFKFIERTKKIEDGPRGVGAEDGLIRIEFEFEQPPAQVINTVYHTYNQWPNPYPQWHAGDYRSTTTSALRSTSSNSPGITLASSSVANTIMPQAMNIASATATAIQEDSYFGATCAASKVESPSLNDVGITVGGSVSDQKFTVGAWFPTDGAKHVMILKLLGQVGEQQVTKPVTVKTKQECPTCGTKNKSGTKFCKECGTGLSIV
jgi:hypothetical protein